MEEEPTSALVTFRSNSVSTREKPKDLEIIYDDVKCEQQESDTHPVKKDYKKKAPLFTLLPLLAVVLGIICVSLLSVLIALSIHSEAVVSDRLRENSNLTAQNLQLWTEKTDLQRRNKELTRERDGLNWTIGVILEHDKFPVDQHCPQKENKEEPTIYDEVKPKVPAATEPDGEAAAARSVFRALAVFSVILCVLLLASVGVIVYVSVVMNQQTAIISNLTAENQQLMTERSVLERETEELSRTAGNLNWTLGVIMKYDKFPVSEFCPKKKCQPCMKDWILFEGKCYLFYAGSRWLTWEDSRKYCQNRAADLVVIDSPHEHEFISNHTEYYYDLAHGYWLGLQETADKNWRWIDGHNDTLGYWIVRDKIGNDGPYVLLIPSRHLTASWDKVNYMYNKFICESDTLIR